MGIIDLITRKPSELRKIDNDVRKLEAEGRKFLAGLKRDSARLELSWHSDSPPEGEKLKELNGSGLMEEIFRDFMGIHREIRILEQIEKTKDNEKKRRQLRNHASPLPEDVQKRFGFKEVKEKERIIHQIAVIKHKRLIKQSGPQLEMKIARLNQEIEKRTPERQVKDPAFVGQLNRKFERYKAYADERIHFYARLKGFIEKLNRDLDALAADVQKLTL